MLLSHKAEIFTYLEDSNQDNLQKMEITQDIKPKSKPTVKYSAVVEDPLNESLKVLESEGYKLISLEENVELRIKQGLNSRVSRFGNWTRDGFLYIPKEGMFITKNSPILDDFQGANQAHSQGKEYFVSNKQVKKALKNSVHVSKDKLASDFYAPTIKIYTFEFDKEEITKFCFGENAHDYGGFLLGLGINSLKFTLYEGDAIYSESNKKSKPFACQLYLEGLHPKSENKDYGETTRIITQTICGEKNQKSQFDYAARGVIRTKSLVKILLSIS